MRAVRLIAIAAFLGTLAGCAVVPYEPGVYAAPPPAAAVLVQPTYGYGYYGYRRHPHRHRHHYWR